MSKARQLYRFHLAIATVAAGGVVLTTILALTRLDLRLPPEAAIVNACQQVIPVGSGLAMLAVIALLALGLFVFGLAARSLARQLSQERRFRARLPQPRAVEVEGERVRVIPGHAVQAFCAGLLRPRIYLTERSLSVLTPEEIRAVIAHEGHHRRRRDPLRILVARVLADALFFVPGLRRFTDRYRQLAELAADERAALAVGREPLASALLAFGSHGKGPATVVGIAPERVDHLLGADPRWQLSPWLLGGSLGAVAALAAAGIALPALTAGGSLGLSLLLAEGCMVAMVALPLAAVAAALSAAKRSSRKAA